eukprot:PhF_6_TR13453/c0_g2_i9/m.21551
MEDNVNSGCPDPKGPCPACGNIEHSDPRECLDSDENLQVAQEKTKSSGFKPNLDNLAKIPHYATLEEAVAVYDKMNLSNQLLFITTTRAKVDEIIQNRDVIELVRLSHWARDERRAYGQDGLEVAIAMDRLNLLANPNRDYVPTALLINNAFQSMIHFCAKRAHSLTQMLQRAKAMGSVDALQVLHKEKLIDAKDLLPWPPGEEPPGDLLVETLRVTMDHVGDLLVQGDVAG